MTDRKTVSTITDLELTTLYDQLDALRAVARGYCPACGRGDAAPTVTDWEQQKRRADQAEELLDIAHDTSNKSEAERARATATIERVRHAVHIADTDDRTDWQRGYRACTERALAALDGEQPTPATTTTPREHCGHLSPETALTSPRTECVLRPGHAGSHADDVGCRWWYDPTLADPKGQP